MTNDKPGIAKAMNSTLKDVVDIVIENNLTHMDPKSAKACGAIIYSSISLFVAHCVENNVPGAVELAKEFPHTKGRLPMTTAYLIEYSIDGHRFSMSHTSERDDDSFTEGFQTVLTVIKSICAYHGVRADQVKFLRVEEISDQITHEEIAELSKEEEANGDE